MTIAAIRYNNPGDVSLPIAGWHGAGTIVGLVGQHGYASFPDMDTGYRAFQCRLASYIREGKNTIRKIGSVYATDPNWAKDVAALSGLPIGAVIDANDTSQMEWLASAIIKQETGMTLITLERKSKEYHHVT